MTQSKIPFLLGWLLVTGCTAMQSMPIDSDPSFWPEYSFSIDGRERFAVSVPEGGYVRVADHDLKLSELDSFTTALSVVYDIQPNSDEFPLTEILVGLALDKQIPGRRTGSFKSATPYAEGNFRTWDVVEFDNGDYGKTYYSALSSRLKLYVTIRMLESTSGDADFQRNREREIAKVVQRIRIFDR
jgi:hypothetical protein